MDISLYQNFLQYPHDVCIILAAVYLSEISNQQCAYSSMEPIVIQNYIVNVQLWQAAQQGMCTHVVKLMPAQLVVPLVCNTHQLGVQCCTSVLCHMLHCLWSRFLHLHLLVCGMEKKHTTELCSSKCPQSTFPSLLMVHHISNDAWPRDTLFT